MRLTESESKQLLRDAGVHVPDFVVLKQEQTPPAELVFPVMLKAQTLTGGRGKAGLIKKASDLDETHQQLAALWKKGYGKRPFDHILLEKQLDIVHEFYVGLTFDTTLRSPVLVLSRFGGMDIEVVSKRQPEGVCKSAINPLVGLERERLEECFAAAGIKDELKESLMRVIEAMYHCFIENDAELVEINPLAEVMRDGKPAFVAADAKIILDDSALSRHDFPFERRTGFRPLTEMEKQARAIDEQSHRGVAGRTLLELDGDIAFLSSGGGASITCLDALITYGGRPANFAEYSGNPERDRVYQLTKLVLSKRGLRGFWLVGPTANFTDVYETLGGVMDALKEIKPAYPIVMRRAGPRDQEAKEMVLATAKEIGLDLTFFGEEMAMTESAKVLVDKVNARDAAIVS